MWIDRKFVEIEKILRNEKGSLLDLGSRDQILKKFLPEKISYTGVDISINKNDNIILDLNQKFNFNNESFDFVTALDVAEHLDDPKTFLRECLRISKKKVLIVLPNVSYYEMRFHFLLKGNLGSKYHFSGDNKDEVVKTLKYTRHWGCANVLLTQCIIIFYVCYYNLRL